MTVSDQAKIGSQFQSRLEFYFFFLGLTFTILALSIQTSNLTTNPFVTIFELMSWVSLLVAGLIGLSRLFWFPTLYNIEDISENILSPRSESHDVAENTLKNIERKIDGRLPW